MSSKPLQLIATPTCSLIEDRVNIKGDGFTPNTKLTLACQLRCSKEDFDFTSYVHIISSHKGAFDLNVTPSLGGTYKGVNGMGLFWSMTSNNSKRLQITNASNPLQYSVETYNGHITDFVGIKPLDSLKITRKIIKDDIIREEISSNGVFGTLFKPPGKGPFPAVMTVLGGVKQRHVVEDYAAVLANKGYITLALAFFGVEGLQKNYATTPVQIEYFENAVKYLQSIDEVNSEAIGVMGFSKGGDISIAMMSHLDGIKFVCVLNGVIFSVGTSTTYKTKTTNMAQQFTDRVKFVGDSIVDISEVMIDPREDPKSVHDFEHSSAELLMLCGSKDLNWKSELHAELAKEKMGAVGKTNYEIVNYDNVGHLIDLPYTPIVTTGMHPLLPKGMLVDFGGTSDDKTAYAKDLELIWKKIFNFFDKQKKIQLMSKL